EHHQHRVKRLAKVEVADVGQFEACFTAPHAGLLQHVGRPVDTHDFVTAVREDHRVSAGSTAQIKYPSNCTLPVQPEDVLDEVALGEIVLIVVQVIVGGSVVAAENALGHANASRTARHTWSISDSSRPSPEGRYSPWR